MTTFGTTVRLFDCAAEDRIYDCFVLTAVVDLHRMMIHFRPTIGTNHFVGLLHLRLPPAQLMVRRKVGVTKVQSPKFIKLQQVGHS